MKINGSPTYVKMVKGLIDHQKKSFEGRLKTNQKLFKEQSPIMQSINASLKAKQKELERLAAEQIAKKISRGEVVTEDERETLRASDPEKLRKADEANEKRRNVSRRLANAKTKSEAQQIISSEKSMALTIYEKGDQELGDLYLEAINKAEVDYYKGKKSNSSAPKDVDDAKRERLFDIRL